MTLDLHGVKHEDVEKVVENTILLGTPPFRIITGNSVRMKQLVLQVLDKHHYTERSDFGTSIVTQ